MLALDHDETYVLSAKPYGHKKSNCETDALDVQQLRSICVESIGYTQKISS